MSNFNEIKPYTYRLYNKVTQQHYYGVRYNNIAKGWTPDEDLWVKYFSSSNKVKALIAQYGKDSFEYEVRKVFDTISEACQYEDEVLRRLHIFGNDKWLNENIAGYVEMTAERKKKISDKVKLLWEDPDYRKRYSKTARKNVYVMTSPTGEIVETNCLNEFADMNNLNRAAIHKVVKGIQYYHKGWTGFIKGKEHLRVKVTKEYNDLGRDDLFKHDRIGKNHSRFNKPQSPESAKALLESHLINDYSIISPSGQKSKVRNLAEYCREHDLDTGAMGRVMHGQSHNHLGYIVWIIGQENLRNEIEEKFKNSKNPNRHLDPNHVYTITDPNGKVYSNVKNLFRFCNTHGLQSSQMYDVTYGKIYQHKRWIGYINGEEHLRNEINDKMKMKFNTSYLILDKDEKYLFKTIRDAANHFGLCEGKLGKKLNKNKHDYKGLKIYKIIGTEACIKSSVTVINT